MLAKHVLNKTTVDQPPRSASPSEKKEERAARLFLGLSSQGWCAGEASQPWETRKVGSTLPPGFGGRCQGEP